MALITHPNSSRSWDKECRDLHAAFDRPAHLGRFLARWSTSAERRQVKEAYRVAYGEDLVDALQKDTVFYLWMLEPQERDAIVARDALELRETDHKALVEIYTRRKSKNLFATKQAYLAKFKAHLDQDVISEPCHAYQRILAALATSHRSHYEEVSQHVAKCDAVKLYGVAKSSTRAMDEAAILEMFSKRSIPQLRLTFASYKHIYGHDYTKILQKDNNGEFEESLRVVIQCMCDPSEYYSEMISASLKGRAANKRVLTRVMIGSTEAGMEEVKAAFEKRHGTKMRDAICENIAEGDYRDFLLALINAAM